MKFSRTISEQIIRFPRWVSVSVIVVVSIFLSLLAGELLMDPRSMPYETWLALFILAIAIPAVVATPVSIIIVSLVHDLEAARKKAVLLANTDMLTGVLNRRHFVEVANYKLTEAHRQREDITVLLLDVDDFKKINDNYGHDAGDAVLKMVAERCHQALRPEDSFARWGGEEFVAVLPGSNQSESIGIALKVRDAIASGAVGAKGSTISVTASIGVATELDGDETLESLLSRADHAMYEAKRSGKNAAVAAP